MPGMADVPMSGISAPETTANPVAGDAVSIENFAFAPAALTVPVGTTVTWTNRDEEPHTVDQRATAASIRPGWGPAPPTRSPSPKAGTFDYVCSIHPFMHATVVVTP